MSQRRPQASSPAPEHSHCLVCGRPVPLGTTFCSEQCEGTFQAQRRRQRRTSWVFMGVLVAIMLFWVFLSGRSGG